MRSDCIMVILGVQRLDARRFRSNALKKYSLRLKLDEQLGTTPHSLRSPVKSTERTYPSGLASIRLLCPSQFPHSLRSQSPETSF